jgi:methylthioribose-1-phosphate isomerase
MNVGDRHYRTIWVKEDNPQVIQIIDQRKLPFAFEVVDLSTVDEVSKSIKDMYVRGAGLIGATAAYGMYLATLSAPKEDFDNYVSIAGDKLKLTRPTAVNLSWAVEIVKGAINLGNTRQEKIDLAFKAANDIADNDAECCRKIGEHGLKIIEEISNRKNGEPVNILTHCNAGWLAFVDYGSATAPIYAAFNKGIKVNVWVDETRPRNQGLRLTSWELTQQGVPHYVIVDNVGGHLMQHGLVDMVIVGTDRTTFTGDVANKIGTYLKALAAKDNNIPFYVALPSSTFDWEIEDGVKEIPIEERDSEEVSVMEGVPIDVTNGGSPREFNIMPFKTPIKNYGFDVTPARLITGLITERGICGANKTEILNLFPKRNN